MPLALLIGAACLVVHQAAATRTSDAPRSAQASDGPPSVHDDADAGDLVLSMPIPALVPLFGGHSIEGWHRLGGEAEYAMADGVLTGSGQGTRNAFLVSPRSYADFVLDVELFIERGNSGIQVRSSVVKRDEHATVSGYQVEIDPTDRAYSGGIYDEGRRGWLFDLKENEPARKAFRAGEWNRFVICCRGPWLRTWVNGVPAADGVDMVDAQGRIAFQVHSGNTLVHWRRAMIAELPEPNIVRLFDGGSVQGWTARSGLPWVIDGVPPTARLLSPATQAEPGALVSDRAYGDCVAFLEGRCDDPAAVFVVRLPENGALDAGIRSQIGVDRLRDDKDHTVAVAIRGTRVNTFVDDRAVGERTEPSMSATGRMAIVASPTQPQGAITLDRGRVAIYPTMDDPRVGPPQDDRAPATAAPR